MTEGYWQLLQPGRWRWVNSKRSAPPARACLPRLPVISDTTEPTEGYWQLLAPGRWRWINGKVSAPAAHSSLPRPFVISDAMEPTEQVDGHFYTSKARFRAVGRALGLTEVGNEKFRPKQRSTALRETKAQRQAALKQAVEMYRAGRRVGPRGQ